MMIVVRRITLSLAFLLAVSAPALAVERIVQFISDVNVQRNGDLQVTETIRVEAEGKAIRRGIFRDFPTSYTRRDGTHAEVGFEVSAVTRNGAAEHYVLERIQNGMRVRIGNADQLIPRGQHAYIIRYRTTRQIGFFQNFDELYWNVTGHGWMFPIDVAEARISLPEKVPFTQTAPYTGPLGGRGQDAVIVSQEPGRIVFRTTRALPLHNGLTVAAAWQKGVIEPPTSAQRAQFWLQDNRGLAIAVVGLILALLYYAFAWLRVGRDPPAGTIIPLFAPPEGMSPAAARYVDRMAFDNQCFTAAVINLGVKGHLRMVETDKKITLEKREGGQPLSSEEQALMGRLFSGGNAILLEQANHEPLGRAKTGLSETLDKSYLGTLFANNYLWSSFGLILVLVVAVGALVAVLANHDNNLFATLLMLLLFGLPFVMGGAALTFIGWQRAFGGKWALIGGLIMLAVAVAAGLYFAWVTEPGAANQILVGSLFAAGALSGAGFPWLKAPSRDGRKTMDQIEGFREYLSVAEEDRLNMMNPPEKTPELFERFLPYAVALDCQNAWAAKFAGVLAAAGTAAAATTWYVGNRDWGRDPVSFANHLGGSLASTLSTSSTAPGSSSGSSGGGFSGGGGGGGGGGGW